ncbi:hypothetical protein D5086_024236 [Populus alba]|uniref:Uncharacterized protein n=1 Tax=Populus alba TaxID=43335 RepID=A0ACC4B4V6_POPAL
MEKVSIQSETAPDLLRGCGKLAEIQGLESVENKPVIRMENCNNLSNNFKEILLQVLSKGKLPDVVLPGSDLPHWFMQYQRDRSSSTFRIPPISAGLSRGLIVWTVYAAIEVARWTGPFLSITFPTCFSLCSARPDISSRCRSFLGDLYPI